jgi:pimeloyl-ACP methyl ester carboxylesterase
MVVIGHSMGGCITRLLITDTGNKILDGYFWEAAGAGADLIRNQKALLRCAHFQAPPGSRPRLLHLLAAARRRYGKQLDRAIREVITAVALVPATGRDSGIRVSLCCSQMMFLL